MHGDLSRVSFFVRAAEKAKPAGADHPVSRHSYLHRGVEYAPPGERGPLGRCGHRPLRTKPIRIVGAAIGRPLPQCDIPQADEQCSPLQGRRTYGNIVGRGLGPAAKGFSWRRSLWADVVIGPYSHAVSALQKGGSRPSPTGSIAQMRKKAGRECVPLCNYSTLARKSCRRGF